MSLKLELTIFYNLNNIFLIEKNCVFTIRSVTLKLRNIDLKQRSFSLVSKQVSI